jgi:hypothetical protein
MGSRRQAGSAPNMAVLISPPEAKAAAPAARPSGVHAELGGPDPFRRSAQRAPRAEHVAELEAGG